MLSNWIRLACKLTLISSAFMVGRSSLTVANDQPLPVVPNSPDIASSRKHATSVYRPADPLSVFPKEGNDGMLSMDKMVGELSSNSMIFSKLYIANDYRSLPMHPPEVVRGRWNLPDGFSAGPTEIFTWIAPDFYHQPLYFEQPNLERYGIGARRYLQPPLSFAHFFGSLSLVPYKMLTVHPCDSVYTLGAVRAGNCAPKERRTLLGQAYPGAALRYWLSDCP